MKKYLFGILSFVLIAFCGIVGGNLLSPDFSAVAEDEIKITEIDVDSAQDFVDAFTNKSTFNNENVVIKINGDLDFTNVELDSIAQNKNVFMGTLDGQGNTISNLNLTSEGLYAGLIPYAKNATIKNLRVSGDVEINFTSPTGEGSSGEMVVGDRYAGVILGYGENVTIKNCELDNAITGEDNKITYNSISLSVDSNINFGFLAGKLKGNPNASNQTMPANIINCVNYYDADITVNKSSNMAIGGLVGVLENCYMLDNINYGKITYSESSSLNTASSNTQYFGGLAGTINGSGLHMRNNLFGGEINSTGSVSELNAKVGAIFGGAVSNSVIKTNINFDYYTQSLLPAGDGYVSASDKVNKIDSLNKNFLLDVENFDQSVEGWDFERAWILIDSKYHIQNFQTFEYTFSSTLDRNNILKDAKFSRSKEEEGEKTFSSKPGNELYIKVYIESAYQGYYYLNKNNAVLLNNAQFTGEYNLKETIKDGKIVGYIIKIEINATTAGEYSFIVSQKTYDCTIAVSDVSQGGVRVYSATSSPSSEFQLTFAHNSDVKQVIAEGKDIYSFDHWELFYKDEYGEFGGEPIEFDQANDAPVTIAFGTAPFNQEFKLVAYFTDEEAITFDLGEINYDYIKSVKLGGKEYSEPEPISPSRVISIEIVTQKNYILNTEEISNFISDLYKTNPSPYPAMKEPTTNEEGETTYIFTIDLNYASKNINNNKLSFEFKTEKDKNSDKNNLLWLYIVLPLVVVIAIGVIIFIVIRRRNGGGKSGGTKTKKKEKSTSYKDYYI